MDLILADIESGPDSGPFTGGNNKIVVDIIVRRPDAIGIPHYKAVTIACKTSKMKTAVKESRGFFQNRSDIGMTGVNFFFFDKEMMKYFHHRREVALLLKLTG